MAEDISAGISSTEISTVDADDMEATGDGDAEETGGPSGGS